MYPPYSGVEGATGVNGFLAVEKIYGAAEEFGKALK